MGSADGLRRTVSRNVSSTPIYDELAATYLADLDLSGLGRPATEATRTGTAPAGQPTPSDAQPRERTKL